eukprot:m.97087 g.97087  ORF g.97087 m.97087 type:complete len:322 (+) comp15211_c0_seq1:700-1665(+)
MADNDSPDQRKRELLAAVAAATAANHRQMALQQQHMQQFQQEKQQEREDQQREQQQQEQEQQQKEQSRQTNGADSRAAADNGSAASTGEDAAAAATAAAIQTLKPVTHLKFLEKLYAITHGDEDLLRSVVNWSEDGTTFWVSDLDKFCKHVLPRFFSHNNYASFVRQLNLYGFRRATESKGKAIPGQPSVERFIHPKFIRGRHDLLSQITRKSQAKRKSDQDSRKRKADGDECASDGFNRAAYDEQFQVLLGQHAQIQHQHTQMQAYHAQMQALHAQLQTQHSQLQVSQLEAEVKQMRGELANTNKLLDSLFGLLSQQQQR